MTAPSHVCACCAGREPPTFEEQQAAWDAYQAAHDKADRTRQLADGVEAVRAWKRFYNVFAEPDRQLPINPPRHSNVAIFPVHRTTRPIGGA